MCSVLMPTTSPLLYRGYLHVCVRNGVHTGDDVDCFLGDHRCGVSAASLPATLVATSLLWAIPDGCGLHDERQSGQWNDLAHCVDSDGDVLGSL
jgi:hypothetical protein